MRLRVITGGAVKVRGALASYDNETAFYKLL